MKRKTLILLLALTLAVCVFAAAVFADANAVQVATANELNTAISEYAGSPKYIQLTANITTADITLTQDVYLDLNGCDITTLTVNGDYTLYCMDSETDDYTVEDGNDYGKIGSVSGNVAAVPAGTVSAVEAVVDGDNQSQCGYLMVTDTEDNNAVSFHRVYAEISAMWLRAKTTIEESGMYYSGVFAGDEVVKENVTYFGVATSVTNLTTDEAWTNGLKASMEADAAGTEGARKVLYSSYTTAEFESEKEYKDTCMYNIMSTEYGPAQNKSRAAMKVYGRAYLMAGDQVVFGQNTRDHSFKTLTEGLDAYYTTSIHTTYPNIIDMYQNAGVTTVMNGWNIPYIKAGAESFEKMLLSRRGTVTDYMQDMMDVQWTLVEDISYNYYYNSSGEATEEAFYLPAYYDVNGDGTKDQIVYQGIPYSHGGGSLDGWTANAAGEADSNGVYTMYGITNNAMNGYVSPNGDVDRGDARLGNDSADAVLWAWAQVSDSLTFRYTGDMLEKKGCVYIGDYEMKYLIDGDDTVYSISSSDSVYPSNSGTAFNGTYAICTYNGTDVMYEAYSMLQSGDVLANRKSGSDGKDGGHAMMVKSIDVANQTVTVMDQTTTNEVALQQYFRGTTTTQPTCLTYNSKLGAYVAVLQNESTYTFEELYNNGYLPMSCSELVDAADTVPTEGTYTYTGSDSDSAADLFDDSYVYSAYPIEYVKLTITNTTTGASKESYCYRRETDRADGKLTLPLSRFEEDAGLGVLQGDIDYSVLGSGDYTCTFAVKLSIDDAEKTFRTVTFNVAEDESDAYRYYYLESITDLEGNKTPFSTNVQKDAVASKAINYYFMSGEGKTMDTSAKVAAKQGDCCLVVFPNGETMLIDVAMKEYYPILEHNLKRLGVTHIDYLVLSHPHDDHCGGLWAGVVKGEWNSTIGNYDYSQSSLLETFSVGEVFHSGLKNSGWESTGTYGRVTYTDTHLHVHDLINNYNSICGTSCKETIVNMDDEVMTFGEGDRQVTIDVLWPGVNNGTDDFTVTEGQLMSGSGKLNNRSIVMRLDYGNHSSLFAGDIYKTYAYDDTKNDTTASADTTGADEAIVAYYGDNLTTVLDADLFKLTHHGDASSSNSQAFFGAVSPKYAVATGFLAFESHWSLYKNADGTRFVQKDENGYMKDNNAFFDRWNGYMHVTAYPEGEENMTVETSRHEYIYSHEETYTYTDESTDYIREGAYLYLGESWAYRTEDEKTAAKPKF